ncbi:MAG: hypothetical protein QM755_03370 [Luteolibacter sp.]
MKYLAFAACLLVGLGAGLARRPGQREVTGSSGATPPEATKARRISTTSRSEGSKSPVRSRRVPALAKPDPPKGTPAQPGPLGDVVKDAMQLGDTALREQAIGKILAGLGSNDPEVVRASLIALNSIGELAIDKQAFRKALEKHLDSTDPAIAGPAWSAAAMLGKQPGDLDRLQQIAWSGALGDITSILLLRFNDGDLSGESGEIVRGLLDTADQSYARGDARHLGRETFLRSGIGSHRAEPGARIRTRYDLLRSRYPGKQESADDRTAAGNLQLDGIRCTTGGLGIAQGVAPGECRPVADAAIQVVESRASGPMLDYSWKLMQRYAGRSQLDALRELAEKSGLAQEQRNQVQGIIHQIESKPQ